MYAVSSPPVQPVYFEEDDYLYYPRYGMYYGHRSHQYYYREGYGVKPELR